MAAGCRQAPPAGAASHVTAFVAASARDAVGEIARQFEQTHGHAVRLNAASASALAQQIVSGAPADVFISANVAWADFVASDTLDRRPLLGNRLVIATPAGNPLRVSSPADLLSDAVRRLALAGEAVPAGIYARQALEKLSLYDQMIASGKVIRGGDVRATLALVELGEADAAIVYATDLRAAPGCMQVFAFPPDLHDPIVYPVVLLRHGEHNPATRAFYDFLSSPSAVEVWTRHGFSVLAESR